MRKLIDAFELMRSMEFYDDCAYCDCDKLECEYDRIYTKRDICDFVESHIFNAPVVDAVEVVRCKDCKHNSLNRRSGNAYCEFGFGLYQLNDFCSRGERREDGVSVED